LADVLPIVAGCIDYESSAPLRVACGLGGEFAPAGLLDRLDLTPFTDYCCGSCRSDQVCYHDRHPPSSFSEYAFSEYSFCDCQVSGPWYRGLAAVCARSLTLGDWPVSAEELQRLAPDLVHFDGACTDWQRGLDGLRLRSLAPRGHGVEYRFDVGALGALPGLRRLDLRGVEPVGDPAALSRLSLDWCAF
jgi:hypothetical protein